MISFRPLPRRLKSAHSAYWSEDIPKSDVATVYGTDHGELRGLIARFNELTSHWRLDRCGDLLRLDHRRRLLQKVRVEGQLTFNGTFQMLNAALAGFGLAYVPEDLVRPHLAKGRLTRVLEDWCPLYAGYHLYYPSRRQPSAAFALLVKALRYPGVIRLECHCVATG